MTIFERLTYMPALLHSAGVSRYFHSIVTSHTQLLNQRKSPAFSKISDFFQKNFFRLPLIAAVLKMKNFSRPPLGT